MKMITSETTQHTVNTRQEASSASLRGSTQDANKAEEAGKDGVPSQDDEEDPQQVLDSALGRMQGRGGLGSKTRR